MRTLQELAANRTQRGSRQQRRGAVAVEFAIVAPILVTILLGMVELSRVFEVQNLLDTAAREGARFAAMDKTGMLQAGQTSNSKLINDVKNFLASNGVPKEHIGVSVKSHDNPTADFNLDDPANALKLFDVNVSVDFSAISSTAVSPGENYTLSGSVTFRNGMSTLSN